MNPITAAILAIGAIVGSFFVASNRAHPGGHAPGDLSRASSDGGGGGGGGAFPDLSGLAITPSTVAAYGMQSATGQFSSGRGDLSFSQTTDTGGGLRFDPPIAAPTPDGSRAHDYVTDPVAHSIAGPIPGTTTAYMSQAAYYQQQAAKGIPVGPVAPTVLVPH